MKKHIDTFCRLEVLPHLNDFFLLGTLFIFALLRIPSLIEPDWYGDEGIYQVIGQALNSGRLLYRDIWDNKPPVLYVYYALTNGDLFAIKFLSLIFGLAAVLVFFYLAKRLFTRNIFSVYISTFVFAVLFGLPLLEGNIANAENFMLFPSILSLFLITKLTNKSKIILPTSIGLLLSLAFLTKIVAVFDLAAFLVILFTLRFYNKPFIDVKKHAVSKPMEFLRVMKQEVVIVVAFCIPIVLVSVFFLANGAFSDFLKATLSQNVGYVGWKNYFLIPQGFLVLKVLLLILSVVIIFIYRKKFSVASLVIYTWLVFSIFNAFFSGRPYTHYVLVALPALCLLLGLALESKKRMFVHLGIFVLLVLLIKFNFDYYKKIIPYYINYNEFVMGRKPVIDYQKFFDRDTPVNYQLSEFIKNSTNKNDNIFLASNSSTVYYLSNKLPPGRYIVAYHIEFYKNAIQETQKALDKKQPKYIISTNQSVADNFLANYALKYILQNIKVYEKQY